MRLLKRWSRALEWSAALIAYERSSTRCCSTRRVQCLNPTKSESTQPERASLALITDSTEKVPGMFGTLVICLPSEHTGGAVRLKHAQKEIIYETTTLSSFNTTYITWYVLRICF